MLLLDDVSLRTTQHPLGLPTLRTLEFPPRIAARGGSARHIAMTGWILVALSPIYHILTHGI